VQCSLLHRHHQTHKWLDIPSLNNLVTKNKSFHFPVLLAEIFGVRFPVLLVEIGLFYLLRSFFSCSITITKSPASTGHAEGPKTAIKEG
jgi:hypothetical protein